MDRKKKRLENIYIRIDALNDVIERMQERAGMSSRLNKHGTPVNEHGKEMLKPEEVRLLEDNVRSLDQLYEQVERLEESM